MSAATETDRSTSTPLWVPGRLTVILSGDNCEESLRILRDALFAAIQPPIIFSIDLCGARPLADLGSYGLMECLVACKKFALDHKRSAVALLGVDNRMCRGLANDILYEAGPMADLADMVVVLRPEFGDPLYAEVLKNRHGKRCVGGIVGDRLAVSCITPEDDAT